MSTLPDELVHPEWNGLYLDRDYSRGIAHTTMQTAESWAVQLHFKSMGDNSTGSGFFLNIPDLKDYELILTAAHNLIDPSGKKVECLEIDDRYQNKLEFGDKDCWWCPEYPTSQKPEHDYAAIRVKRSESVRGFGFSMRLGEGDHLSETVGVTGYRNIEPRQPSTSMGSVVVCFGSAHELVEYRATTEQGISGSAVWMGFNGVPTAIAIHNRRPQSKKGGSRGSRLTPKVLREVFQWLGVGKYEVKLQAQAFAGMFLPANMPQPPPRGLYLNFSSTYSSARVRLGDGSAFDVLPAQAAAQSAKVLYSLSYQGKWVLFDPIRQEVVLQDSISDRCLFFMDASSSRGLRIVVQIPGKTESQDQKYQLRLQGEMIYDFGDDDDLESSEVSLIKYPSKNTPVSKV
ncbi:hypothetical protein K435DRAFT_769997 [Dendrothele bispora CBS 962.96]|uniref:Serine protease n=1 Tax=Dendrothele bispora (strain CBS 962.96) TaxID=1314807 RepID=A0A4S8KQ17_DENBC|nr:hypothetical protein K435DRAFT_769997 [Dendrothele bispora CBS 962.96]